LAQEAFCNGPARHAQQDEHAGRIDRQVRFLVRAEEQEADADDADFDPYRKIGDRVLVGRAHARRHVATLLETERQILQPLRAGRRSRHQHRNAHQGAQVRERARQQVVHRLRDH
jgi:hypothetical protein